MKISSLQRIYIEGRFTAGAILTLTPEQTHYLTSVMRAKVGWQFRIFNGSSGEFIVKVHEITKKSCSIEILSLFREPSVMPTLILAQGIIKGDRMMDALSMTTQIGVTEIVPIITERTQAKTINHERAARILIENSEQSERLSIPKLYAPETLEEFIKRGDFDSLIYANENETVASSFNKTGDRIAILIGSEGGFTDEELLILQSHPKARSISLGRTVLRSETAAVVLAGLVQMLRV